MTIGGTERLSLGEVNSLEDVIEREALTEICRSVFELFGISIRVFSRGGALLADVHEEREICRYVNTLRSGRFACSGTVTKVQGLQPDDGPIVHPCFTGAVYRAESIAYQGRRLGRFILGPYLPMEVVETPESLRTIDPELDPHTANEALNRMPKVRAETADRITAHVRNVLDLILFSSHKSRLTSEMHVASVRESYRELAEKNSELQQAYDRLKELDQLKSNFLATVSHELRTPLTSILGYSEMLGTGMAGSLNDEQIAFVETIRTKGNHLLLLITSLLDLSKLEQGHLALKLEPLDVPALLQEVSSTISLQAEKKGVRIVVEKGANLPEVRLDPLRVRQILTNLTDNALKFTPRGGEIRLKARAVDVENTTETDDPLAVVVMAAPKRSLVLSVSDTGIGIPQDAMGRVFDAFYQVDGSSTREHGGAGLGLSIVKRLVEAHQGRVRVESTLGQGTTFTVLFPEHEEPPR